MFFILFSILFVAITIFNYGGFEEFMETQKAIQEATEN